MGALLFGLLPLTVGNSYDAGGKARSFGIGREGHPEERLDAGDVSGHIGSLIFIIVSRQES